MRSKPVSVEWSWSLQNSISATMDIPLNTRCLYQAAESFLQYGLREFGCAQYVNKPVIAVVEAGVCPNP